jgi:hypothetical protein
MRINGVKYRWSELFEVFRLCCRIIRQRHGSYEREVQAAHEVIARAHLRSGGLSQG